ncbi:MAG: helix-turn-helix transcriptional regulator [Alphaproteobacteria bacterium]|jgi:DNA-binding XRE family transcriptional regulator|nr:helix-turn-helix transcriptional regulator [Alphaproteobacteria bacterium]
MLTGPYVRAARAILKMSQVELAELVGVSYVVIRNVESTDGICDGKGHVLYKIEKIFKENGIKFDLTSNDLTIKCSVNLEAGFLDDDSSCSSQPDLKVIGS